MSNLDNSTANAKRSDEPDKLRFRISSYCQGGGCVAVAHHADGAVSIRNTQAAPTITFTKQEWDIFLKGVHNHEFESPAESTN